MRHGLLLDTVARCPLAMVWFGVSLVRRVFSERFVMVRAGFPVRFQGLALDQDKLGLVFPRLWRPFVPG